MKQLEDLAAVSRLYGGNLDYVFLGGGNTSFKTDDTLYIKPSGVALAGIQADQFIAMDREALRKIFSDALPDDIWEREAAVKDLMAAAVRPRGTGRASVEAPVHEAIDYAYVVHLHPALVNGMTCAVDGYEACSTLFPDALWLDYCNPGATLSLMVRQELRAARLESGVTPQVVFLQNHGVFVAADTLEDIQETYESIMATLRDRYLEAGVGTTLLSGDLNEQTMAQEAPALRTILGDGHRRAVVTAADPFDVAQGPLSPDHIVYAKSFSMRWEGKAEDITAFRDAHGYAPRVIRCGDDAVLCAGETLKDARAARIAARDAATVQQLTSAFGGPRFLTEVQYGFIENWEVESYRRKVGAAETSAAGAMTHRVCVVTGAAQGFGLGIARSLLADGAIVALADLNLEGAQQAAADLGGQFGPHRAFALKVDIADEDSVRDMVAAVVRECGGVDLFVANAGVLKASPVTEFSKADWDFVTRVNYTGYFLCVKHVAPIMKAQAVEGTGAWSDIVQVNSKSGLEGSNRNAAYAGSKFGTIGLTQSFAKELVDSRIKVNSVCPGNYFDGPLWSDPERGLFAQYLRTGKVPGAETVADVRKAYEAKVPMARGCRPEDVARAIIYCVEQEYETGQAIPVTGGQIMLK